MAFSLETWRDGVKQKMQGWKTWMETHAIDSVYATIATFGLWPAVAAAQKGEWAAIAALGGVMSGIGTNLLANRIQSWKDEAEAARDIAEQVENDAALRAELDAVIEQLNVISQAKKVLSEDDQHWFVTTLRKELQEFGNLQKFEAKLKGSGAIAQGEGAKAVGERGVLIEGDHNWVMIDQRTDDNSSQETTTALRSAYLNRLFEKAGQLSLVGIDPKAASESKSRLNLGAVYTALMTISQEQHKPTAASMETDREGKKLSALDQLNRHKRLVLLGEPGSGKSTFVNFVALCLAGDTLKDDDFNLELLTTPLPKEEDGKDKKKEVPQKWEHKGILPVCVILRDFAARILPEAGKDANADHLLKFITDELGDTLEDFAPVLKQELLQKGGLILLDGLDEVPQANERRVQLRQVVEDFAATFKHCRILVTSRTYAYQKQDWRLPGFHEAVLAPFSLGQSKRFVERWYDHIAVIRDMNKDDARGRAELLKHAISNTPSLRALAERPLLLTLMASLHAWRGGSLPEKREELYNDTVDLLLDWWESQRIVRDNDGNITLIQPSLAEWLDTDRQKVRELLNELAYEAHRSQSGLEGTADVPEGRLVSGLMQLRQSSDNNPDANPAKLMDYLSQRAGLLLPRGVGVYTFPHRTFQEYLAACHLTDHGYPDQVAELVREDPNRWRETALLAGAKAARGSAFAIWALTECLCHREPNREEDDEQELWAAHLAGQALVQIADLSKIAVHNRPKVTRVQNWLIEIMNRRDFPAIERALAGNNLAMLGDPRQEVITGDHMQFCLVPAGPFWMGEDSGQHKNEHLDYDFWMSRYPITNAQYQEFVKAGGYEQERYWQEAQQEGIWQNGKVKGGWDDKPRSAPHKYRPPFNLPNHPVVGVMWYEALAFSRWLSEKWQQDGLLPKDWKVILPSEAEWEKAARGGEQIPGNPIIRPAVEIKSLGRHEFDVQPNNDSKREYPWGNTRESNLANYDETKIGATNTVGCFPYGASPYGCEEMSGNAWEWTRSLLKDFRYDPKDGREKLDESQKAARVLRGGAFLDRHGSVRCSYRLGGFTRTFRPTTSGFALQSRHFFCNSGLCFLWSLNSERSEYLENFSNFRSTINGRTRDAHLHPNFRFSHLALAGNQQIPKSAAT